MEAARCELIDGDFMWLGTEVEVPTSVLIEPHGHASAGITGQLSSPQRIFIVFYIMPY